MTIVNVFAANKAGGKLVPYKYKMPDLGSDLVDIKVHYCGICHSDLNMITTNQITHAELKNT